VPHHDAEDTVLMLRFHTSGDAFTRGRQQGEATRLLTQTWMSSALEQLAENGGGSVDDLIHRSQPEINRWIAQWEGIFPPGVLECRGIAEGLGWSWEKYATALCHHRLSGDLPKCTLVGLRDEGRPLFGKTDDIGLHQLGLNVMEISRPDVGHAHLHFHFAGTPWTVAGANAAGLMMGMTGIPGPMRDENGLFPLMGLHTVLPACASVDEAISHLDPLPLNAYGFSLMLADRGGDFALVEKTGAGMTVIRADDKPLVHTNHILDDVFVAQNLQQSEPILSNGQRRYDTAKKRAADGVSVDSILADRSPQGAICQQGEAGLHTDFALLFDAVNDRLSLWAGYPGVVAPEIIDVGALLG